MDGKSLERLWCHMVMNQSLNSSYDTSHATSTEEYQKMVWYTYLVHFHSGNTENRANNSSLAQWKCSLGGTTDASPPDAPSTDRNQNHSSPIAFSFHMSTGLCCVLTVRHLPPAPPPPAQRKKQDPKETHLLMVSVGLRTRSLLFPDWTETQETHGERAPHAGTPASQWGGGVLQ